MSHEEQWAAHMRGSSQDVRSAFQRRGLPLQRFKLAGRTGRLLLNHDPLLPLCSELRLLEHLRCGDVTLKGGLAGLPFLNLDCFQEWCLGGLDGADNLNVVRLGFEEARLGGVGLG